MRYVLLSVVAACLGAVSVTAQAQADDARAKKIVGGSCFLCHGADGESGSEAFPRLAGQNAEYIARQLADFKSGRRKSSAMASMVANLSPQDMAALGAFFASRPPHKEPASDAQLAAAGQKLYAQGDESRGVHACAGCHGTDGAGNAQLPRLAGQHAAYLENQLKQFHTRERTNDNAVMHHIVVKMTPQEMAAVSEYLSGQ
jgi:cytochrome c553